MNTIGSAVSNVANVTQDAISVISEGFNESQTIGAEGRFRKAFSSFSREIFLVGKFLDCIGNIILEYLL